MPTEAFIDCQGTVRLGAWILEPGSGPELRLTYRIATTKLNIVRQELRLGRVGKGWQVLGNAEVIHHLR